MNRLISYPRSGNHWVRFIIEFLSNRPTDYLLNKDDGPIYKNTFLFQQTPFVVLEVPCPIHIKNEEPIFFKQHDIDSHPKINNNEKIILIVRKPKEAIIRHNINIIFPFNNAKCDYKNGQLELKYSFIESVAYQRNFEFAINNNDTIISHDMINTHGVKKQITNLLSSEDIDHYFSLLKLYDDFEGDKLLLKYEDLINDCESVAIKINDFLKIKDKKYLDDFIENKEYYAEISRRARGREWIGSVSKNDLNYHAKKAKEKYPNIDFSYFDEYMLKKYGSLIEKYNIKI